MPTTRCPSRVAAEHLRVGDLIRVGPRATRLVIQRFPPARRVDGTSLPRLSLNGDVRNVRLLDGINASWSGLVTIEPGTLIDTDTTRRVRPVR